MFSSGGCFFEGKNGVYDASHTQRKKEFYFLFTVKILEIGIDQVAQHRYNL